MKILKDIFELFKKVLLKFFDLQKICFSPILVSILWVVNVKETATAIFSQQDADTSGEIRDGEIKINGILTSFKILWMYMKYNDEDHRHILLALSSMAMVYETPWVIDIAFKLLQLISNGTCYCIVEKCIAAWVIMLIVMSAFIVVGTIVFDIRDWHNDAISNKIEK